jgi:hypothetical protein
MTFVSSKMVLKAGKLPDLPLEFTTTILADLTGWP